MNIATATPAEVDTEIARLDTEIARLQDEKERAHEFMAQWVRAQGTPAANLSRYSQAKYDEAKALVTANLGKIQDLAMQRHPLSARYNAERWTRYYLVNNSNGHVHTHTGCRTCYTTTEFVWLTEHSGATHEELTGLAGELSCAECFPNLPAEIMKRKTRIEDPAKRKSREERDAAKAAREAKRLEKALLPDGSDLVVSGDRIGTLHSARGYLTDAYWWNAFSARLGKGTHPSYPEADVQKVAEAVAAKEGKSVPTVRVEAEVRALKRK